MMARHEIFVLGDDMGQVIEHVSKFFASGYTWGQKPEMNDDGDWIASAIKIAEGESVQN